MVTYNGKKSTGLDPVAACRTAETNGAGEIVINSVDRDGTGLGYDMDLVACIRPEISLPMTVLGGAGSLGDIQALIQRFGICGAAAGSLFVFKGKYKAVLINYPKPADKDRLVEL